MATSVQTFSTPGTFSWICPPGVFAVKVECWGGGGPGGPATGTASGAGGGAGGQYAVGNAVPVVPGTSYQIIVAAAKVAPATVPANGNDSTFATTTIVAKGGAGAVAATAATGVGATGSSASGVGDSVFAGGSGGNGVSSTQSGGGGGGAGSGGAGNAGSGATAGVAKATGGGAGGTGVTVAAGVNPGSNFGGGGSGGLSSTSTDRAGGNGAQGQVVLTWTTPLTEKLMDNFDDNSTNTNVWASFHNGTATIAESGGVVLATPGVSNATSGYGGYDTANGFYDLTGSFVLCQISQAVNAAVGAQQYLKVAVDSNNSLQFLLENGGLQFQKTVATVTSNLNAGVTFSATTHKWWRIRESAGTIFFDTSPDGITWTNQFNGANPLTTTSVFIEFAAGTYQSVASPGAGQFDYYNMPTPVGRDISDSENVPGMTTNQAPQRASFF